MVKSIPMSKNFTENLGGIMKNNTHIHHSQIAGDIIVYGHSLCNMKVRENKYKITVVAHNLFRFDIFFLLKGLRTAVWRTRDINVGARTLSFANISNQIIFFDTIKYFQQSLGVLAKGLTDNEKSAISKECEKFIIRDESLSKRFLSCSEEEKNGFLIIF